MKFINLSYNKISKLPKLNSDDNTIYFIAENLVKTADQKNYIFDYDISKNLPKEFMEFIRYIIKKISNFLPKNNLFAYM